jgi:ketosteroid isomerase-like protein
MHGGTLMLTPVSFALVPAGPACDGGRVAWADGYAMAAAVKCWGAAQRRGPWLGTWPVSLVSLGEGLMTEVIDRLAAAMNAHDLDAVAGLIHEDYRSEQPAHPGRAFAGRAQMLANWEAMLAGVPDFRAEICRSVQDGDTTWTEWRWSGTRSDGQAFEMRGVTLFEVTGGQVAAGRLYLEDVEQDVVSIEQAVQDLSGRRPRSAHK